VIDHKRWGGKKRKKRRKRKKKGATLLQTSHSAAASGWCEKRGKRERFPESRGGKPHQLVINTGVTKRKKGEEKGEGGRWVCSIRSPVFSFLSRALGEQRGRKRKGEKKKGGEEVGSGREEFITP